MVISALLLGDFSGINPASRFLIGLFLVLLILNPVAFLWSSREEVFSKKKVSPFAKEEARIIELERRIEQLQAENQHLQTIDRAKSEFVSRTTHQLRTPLSAIKWTFHMIMNGDLGAVTADQRTFLEKGYESAERVITVINDWLSLDYLEANRTKYQIVPVNVCELIDGVVFEFNEKAKEKNQTVVVERPKTNLPLLPLDPIKFGMVMENLLDNAIKYTPVGGRITVTVSDDKMNAAEKMLEVVVADTGIGIPKGEQEKIFQQFFRSSNASQLAPRGSGLGLFIVRDIVEGHGGKIWFESEEGKGTQFHLAIPIRENKV